MLYLCIRNLTPRPGGGIGRRAGLKHQWGNTRAGSIPALGTKKPVDHLIDRLFVFNGGKIGTINKGQVEK